MYAILAYDLLDVRDIQALSAMGKGEAEWVALPGSVFKITRVDQAAKRNTPFGPRPTTFVNIHVKQVGVRAKKR